MVVLAPGSANARPSAQPPIDTTYLKWPTLVCSAGHMHFARTNFCSRQWGSSLPGLRMRDSPLSPPLT